MAKRYKVTLERKEREVLEAITRKGSHRSQKVINALILLNCDESAGDPERFSSEQVAKVLQVSSRKIERVKRRFVEEGLEKALSGRQGQREYERKADGVFEARLVALSCSEPPKGFAQWSLST